MESRPFMTWLEAEEEERATRRPGEATMKLGSLPSELVQAILSLLSARDLGALNLCSRWAYRVATPALWRHVELVDCRCGPWPAVDEHDDTPIIRKLLVLAQQPWIAAQVWTLTHRCHLVPPAAVEQLPHMAFGGSMLSCDARTVELVKMAVRHMVALREVRIVLGHAHLVDAILRTVFDRARPRHRPVTRLWVENARIAAGLQRTAGPGPAPYGLPSHLDFSGLQSVRFRRLPMLPGTPFDAQPTGTHSLYCRDGIRAEILGLSGYYCTPLINQSSENSVGKWLALWKEDLRMREEWGDYSPPMDPCRLEEFFAKAHRFDDEIYRRIGETVSLPKEVVELGRLSRAERAQMSYRGNWLDPDDQAVAEMAATVHPTWLDMDMQREKTSSANVAIAMFRNVGATLTSLNLDWVLNVPQLLGTPQDPKAFSRWCSFYLDLLSCRFPHLRAFQLRNCVTPQTMMPQELYLLGPSFAAAAEHLLESFGAGSPHSASSLRLAALEFMEAHPNLECLAWPQDQFFPHTGVPCDMASRVEAVIDNLSRTLVDLRIDTAFTDVEAQSEESGVFDRAARTRRRLFVTEFAAKMHKVESIKIEGGMPRDERREIVRALHACPLRKIVMIGTCSSIGNTWGANGEDFNFSFIDHARWDFEGEDQAAVYHLARRDLEPPSHTFRYQPQYGCRSMPPMLHTLASFHANTVRELKFCGYKGSTVLFSPTAITFPLLYPLKHFHHLQLLVMSMYLDPTFEGVGYDLEVINCWTESRTPDSTALARTTDEEAEGWERELRTKYAPGALARKITSFVGAFLSEEAKRRKGGVQVRASLCVGDLVGAFDVDVVIGKGSSNSDVCLGFEGPRGEHEEQRRAGKMEGRRWF